MKTLFTLPNTDVRICVVTPTTNTNLAIPAAWNSLTDEERADHQLLQQYASVRYEGAQPQLRGTNPTRPLCADDVSTLVPLGQDNRTVLPHEWYDEAIDRVDFFDSFACSDYIFAISGTNMPRIQIGCRIVFDVFGLPSDYLQSHPDYVDGRVELCQFYLHHDLCATHHLPSYVQTFGSVVQNHIDRLGERR